MRHQTVFKRYEIKYILDTGQKERLFAHMAPFVLPDPHGQSIIRNVYLDTDSYRLIRHSIDRPPYKEKLRLRAYRPLSAQDEVFVELKKKYDHVVYKRRLTAKLAEAQDWLSGSAPPPCDTQIAREIDYARRYYGTLRPAVLLTYAREAFYGREDTGFRLTFDEQILARTEEVSLTAPVYGTPLLAKGLTLLEVKCNGGIPLWLAHFLSTEGIYKTSFSKYGTAYRTLIHPNTKELRDEYIFSGNL